MADAGELCALILERPGYELDRTLAREGFISCRSSSRGRFLDVDLARWLRAENHNILNQLPFGFMNRDNKRLTVMAI